MGHAQGREEPREGSDDTPPDGGEQHLGHGGNGPRSRGCAEKRTCRSHQDEQIREPKGNWHRRPIEGRTRVLKALYHGAQPRHVLKVTGGLGGRHGTSEPIRPVMRRRWSGHWVTSSYSRSRPPSIGSRRPRPPRFSTGAPRRRPGSGGRRASSGRRERRNCPSPREACEATARTRSSTYSRNRNARWRRRDGSSVRAAGSSWPVGTGTPS
ncbi:hypothetical protein SLI_7257 [Streptomyces lividans 1326]|uniref:Uncharacterized protein n=1 Tax=Streptomyces lividans 1326 TaxID=1200984 RepID=A0A7U9DXG9_STRLI|nr:hypothetical protein SLI_7257 [Streptomyces lividans 1326]